jgi:hypothetical protein
VVAFVFFDEFKKRLGDGDIDLTTSTGHTFKFYLTNTAPNVDTHDDKADHTPISATGGYVEKTLTHAWAETSAGTGIYRFANNADIVWTASGGTFDTFRYAVLYDDTHASDALVGYFDNGSTVSLTDTNTFTINLDANFEIFTLDG